MPQQFQGVDAERMMAQNTRHRIRTQILKDIEDSQFLTPEDVVAVIRETIAQWEEDQNPKIEQKLR